VQEDNQLAALGIVTILAALINFAAFDAMVIEPRQPLEKTQIFECEPRIYNRGVRIYSRRYVPMLLREASDYFIFERAIVSQKKIQRRDRGEYYQAATPTNANFKMVLSDIR